MKGTFVGVILTIAILILAFSGAFYAAISSHYINLKISLKSSEILKSVDFVEAVKIGLDKAYNYSFFQAAYEIGKLGGFKDESSIKEWRYYETVNFPSYEENIRSMTEEYITQYLENLNSFEPRFEFSNPKVTFKYVTERLAPIMLVSFNQHFNYSGNFFAIRENASREVYLPYDVFASYDIGRSDFISRDKVREIIEKVEKEEMEEKCKKIDLGNVCEYNKKDAESVLDENCKDADEKFKNKVIKKTEEPKEYAFNFLEMKVNKIKVKHESSEKYERFEENKACGCKREVWYQVDNGTIPCDDYCRQNGYEKSKFEDNKCYCGMCGEYYKMYYNLVYEYKYFAAVSASVNITTKDQYPVFDKLEGTTKFRNISLIFEVITSNDYSWRPL
ncbi:MAG: hypothetical protein RQ930_01325 [Candidatus Aenigmarchaeota archaeon]|nr:hypothetical protein [Candidatus Aenigmarchaeota archaeon]